jgi:hypothetical protein
MTPSAANRTWLVLSRIASRRWDRAMKQLPAKQGKSYEGDECADDSRDVAPFFEGHVETFTQKAAYRYLPQLLRISGHQFLNCS